MEILLEKSYIPQSSSTSFLTSPLNLDQKSYIPFL